MVDICIIAIKYITEANYNHSHEGLECLSPPAGDSPWECHTDHLLVGRLVFSFLSFFSLQLCAM